MRRKASISSLVVEDSPILTGLSSCREMLFVDSIFFGPFVGESPKESLEPFLESLEVLIIGLYSSVCPPSEISPSLTPSFNFITARQIKKKKNGYRSQCLEAGSR